LEKIRATTVFNNFQVTFVSALLCVAVSGSDLPVAKRGIAGYGGGYGGNSGGFGGGHGGNNGGYGGGHGGNNGKKKSNFITLQVF